MTFRCIRRRLTNLGQVSYKVPFSAHLMKPLAVATAMMGLFVLAFAAKSVDVRIQK